jgi:hypothetical protein
MGGRCAPVKQSRARVGTGWPALSASSALLELLPSKERLKRLHSRVARDSAYSRLPTLITPWGAQTRSSGRRFVGEDTVIVNFRMVGPGRGNNFLLHATLHVTGNASGDLAVFVSNTTEECH